MLALLLLFGCAAAARDDVEPQLLSVFPIGGQQGTTYRAAIRGHSLDGAYALWFAFPAFKAKVLTLEEDPDQPQPEKRDEGDREPQVIQRFEVDISVPSEADPGRHLFRVVTPQGLSNPLDLYIHRQEALREQAGRHELPSQAQPLAVAHPRHARFGAANASEQPWRTAKPRSAALDFEIRSLS